MEIVLFAPLSGRPRLRGQCSRRLISLALLLALIGAAAPSPARAGGGGSGGDLTAISLLIETGDTRVDLGERYALAVIGQNFDGQTHSASAGYYGNPWVRDSFAWGMIPSRRDPSLSAYSSSELAYWLARPQPFGGWLTARKSGWFDETPIMISAVLDSYDLTHNLTMVRRALPEVERAWRWLARGFIKPSDGSDVLLYANVPPHIATDWVDQIARRGYATQLEALWYHATQSLSTLESLVRHYGSAARYARFATRIRRDINRLLWTGGAPYVYRAPRVPAFGHYRSWIGPREYFELDSNALCILYGIADPAQAASINRFLEQHAGYLLGLDTTSGAPARVLYGDYAPADYAVKHNRIGVGRYQSAYWPSVGALVALALAHSGLIDEARTLIIRLSDAFDAGQDIREWYDAGGQGQGAPHFQWAARMFIIALYRVYGSQTTPALSTAAQV